MFFRHAGFPTGAEPASDLACAKVMGAWRNRPGAFRPSSIVNISGMSYGSLSGPAIEALNRGSALASCLHNTGEGGISSHHRCGGDLVFQIGTGYFGAGPLTFTDHVALPFQAGFAEVYQTFVAAGLHRDVVFAGSGKLGFAPEAMAAMVMGVDLLNVGREAMMAVGCLQAQRCHTGHCPTGVATQSRWLARGLDPKDKSVRLANYVAGLRAELSRLAQAMGSAHPSLVDPSGVEVRSADGRLEPLLKAVGYGPEAWDARRPRATL